jgi:hypothetical protein
VEDSSRKKSRKTSNVLIEQRPFQALVLKNIWLHSCVTGGITPYVTFTVSFGIVLLSRRFKYNYLSKLYLAYESYGMIEHISLETTQAIAASNFAFGLAYEDTVRTGYCGTEWYSIDVR